MRRTSDIEELLPPFRRVVAVVLHSTGGRLHETYRSPERSRLLVQQGVSRANGLSMHCYRIACDIICPDHQWSCKAHGCDFYDRLGAAYASHGVTWGGNWDGDSVTREQREHDLPHGQGVPLALQARVRVATQHEIEELVTRYVK